MLKIGHRGASGYLPENTIASFQKAIELGANGIELDVHLSKTGEVVVIHDDTVNRTTDDFGLVEDFSLEQLRHLGIPSLEDVLQEIGKDIYCFIEIKPANAALPTMNLVADYIKKGWNKLRIISFEHEALELILQKMPELYIGFSFEELNPQAIVQAAKAGAKLICPLHKLITKDYIKKAHDFGLEVIAWTVNSPEEIAQMYELQVDGIIGDYPDRL